MNEKSHIQISISRESFLETKYNLYRACKKNLLNATQWEQEENKGFLNIEVKKNIYKKWILWKYKYYFLNFE